MVGFSKRAKYASIFLGSALLAMPVMVQADEVADVVIKGGLVYRGDLAAAKVEDVAIKDGKIIFVGQLDKISAAQVIDARGKIVAPGFIDPHTHAAEELSNPDKSANLNYLFQGVSTVFIGNDGHGAANIQEQQDAFEDYGIGTNVALYVGHGGVRRAVMGTENRAPTKAEMDQMLALVKSAMEAGALGLSTGLFYVPGAYAKTDEVVALSKVAAHYGGVYDTHLRDESSYTIGLKGAIQETLDIGKAADIPVHFAHIKALGVDVWGQSKDVIAMVDAAHHAGQKVTADQYPWRASGTGLSAALLPKWSQAGGREAMLKRLDTPEDYTKIRTAMVDNMRRRGGAESLMITGPYGDITPADVVTKNLAEIGEMWQMDPLDVAEKIIRDGDSRIASFNMNPTDIEAFMTQPWVMSSSDGSTGHPRKFASYPKKYQDYVKNRHVLSMAEFVHKSSGLVADTFNLCDRGYIRAGKAADVIVLDPETFQPQADFQNPTRLSTGVDHMLVNGVTVISGGHYMGKKPGKGLDKGHCNHK